MSHETTGYHGAFSTFSTWVAHWTGSPTAFLVAVIAVVAGLATVGVETTNIAISIVTLLMVFVIQNTQNRDSLATHVKLDELIVHLRGARNELAASEELTEDEISALRGSSEDIARMED